VVREGVGQRREMTQALYAHMNNKAIKKKEKKSSLVLGEVIHVGPFLFLFFASIGELNGSSLLKCI
jgi:hypothetical protein